MVIVANISLTRVFGSYVSSIFSGSGRAARPPRRSHACAHLLRSALLFPDRLARALFSRDWPARDWRGWEPPAALKAPVRGVVRPAACCCDRGQGVHFRAPAPGLGWRLRLPERIAN